MCMRVWPGPAKLRGDRAPIKNDGRSIEPSIWGRRGVQIRARRKEARPWAAGCAFGPVSDVKSSLTRMAADQTLLSGDWGKAR